MIPQSIFITGTDTGVGKTTMTAALVLALQQQGQAV
ncbi:MAG: AAA family ATPase, partial [Nitrospirota bacterium]|nr:AAA family ATPase [Nitrospirota bacterium]